MFDILFEDEFILAMDKPSGIPSQSQAENEIRTCEALMKAQRPEDSLYLLHRLDNGTSGVLLFAKNGLIFNEMREKFKLKSIRKLYTAFARKADGPWDSLQSLSLPHRISTPLAHHPKSKKRMIPLPPDKKRQYRGKPFPAETIIHSISTTQFEEQTCTQIEVEILTGVMHQIRVHLASLGYPLLGDPIYSNDKEPSIRLGLHARLIAFELRGRQYEIEAPLK